MKEREREREKKKTGNTVQLASPFSVCFCCTVQWNMQHRFLKKMENTLFLYKYVNNIQWLLSVVAVIELTLRLAPSSSVYSHGKMCY